MFFQTATPVKLLFILLLSAGLGSCNKLLKVSSPPGEISIDGAFNDSTTAIAAVYGIYQGMLKHAFFEWCGLSYNTARSADEVKYELAIDYFALDSLLYTDADIRTMWVQGFESMSMINACMMGLQAATELPPSLRRHLLGETLFCRAFVNFYLVNLWGDAIPLITTADIDVNRFAPSVPQRKVYDQVIADLLQAQVLLTDTDPGNKMRPTGMAANALLARVYLYQGRYNDAITQATSVIASNLYAPLPPVAATFWTSSREAIWSLQPPRNLASQPEPVGDAKLYLGTVNSLSPQLLAAFEPGDLRRQTWVTSNTILATTYTTASKYKKLQAGTSTSSQPENYVVLRLAEQYLIRAEAYAQLGHTAAAISDLNIIRDRAGLPALPALPDQRQCMLAVEQERRVELFTEWGHRWLDLKRWPGIVNRAISRADEVLGTVKGDWQTTDRWYPVPRQELQLNPYLVQNPGYPAR